VFIRWIRMIRSVAGGALGSLYYVASYSPELGAPPPAQLPFINQAANVSGDSMIIQSAVQHELVVLMLPFADGGLDRGQAVGRGWGRALTLRGESYPISQPLSDWSRGVREGWLPATSFQTTIVETGQPLLFSTAAIPSYLQAAFFGAQDSDYPGADTSVITAARLSASFSFASPLASPRYVNPPLGLRSKLLNHSHIGE